MPSFAPSGPVEALLAIGIVALTGALGFAVKAFLASVARERETTAQLLQALNQNSVAMERQAGAMRTLALELARVGVRTNLSGK